MRILVYTRDNPWEGRSGVAAYCRDLTPVLEGRGHRVIHAFSDERGWSPVPRLRHGRHGNTPFVSIVNSPLHPEYSVSNPLQDVGQRRVERLFGLIIDHVHPDVVHFHTLMGLPAEAFRLCQERRIPAVLTFHDFWMACPRGFLIRTDGSLCSGPDEGRNCVQFCASPLPLRRGAYRWLAAVLPPGPLRTQLSRLRASYAAQQGARRAPWAQSLRPRPDLARPHANGAGPYGERQTQMLRIVGEAAAELLAVSGYVSSVLVAQGVPADRLTTLPLGLGISEWVTHTVRTAARPVRFGILGRASPIKGTHILAQAARQFDPDEASFDFLGAASPEVEAAVRSLAGPRPLLRFHGPYRREDLGKLLQEIDVVVVPSLAPETVGLPALEAQAAGCPVIASRIGALPEWVLDRENGLLVEPGNVEELTRALRTVVDNPDLVAAWSASTMPPPSIHHHADALVDIYERALLKEIV